MNVDSIKRTLKDMADTYRKYVHDYWKQLLKKFNWTLQAILMWQIGGKLVAIILNRLDASSIHCIVLVVIYQNICFGLSHGDKYAKTSIETSQDTRITYFIFLTLCVSINIASRYVSFHDHHSIYHIPALSCLQLPTEAVFYVVKTKIEIFLTITIKKGKKIMISNKSSQQPDHS